MKRRWEPHEIVVIPHQVTDKEFKQIVAELAQLMYFKFRQLQKEQTQSACPNPDAHIWQERTGRKYA